MSALTEVVSALIDAAFGTGGITDAQHTELHAKLDGADKPAEAPAEPVQEPAEPVAPVDPFGTEDHTNG